MLWNDNWQITWNFIVLWKQAHSHFFEHCFDLTMQVAVLTINLLFFSHISVSEMLTAGDILFMFTPRCVATRLVVMSHFLQSAINPWLCVQQNNEILMSGSSQFWSQQLISRRPEWLRTEWQRTDWLMTSSPTQVAGLQLSHTAHASGIPTIHT